ncbi:hypothetical protein IB236_03580 [Acidovorax sp. ACV02]|uniref:GTPase-associated system all-helical protein GASH n=1 Tax=Acidovorax sp. ACV02 TaxID=2769310 RepID=UPI0017810DA5|nr:GTPase-associated system all-helical protein GASH [Acidovorax sp. ACV02]MBD9404396.1 hypothetical protein [Acidovorax sp. ACV02]
MEQEILMQFLEAGVIDLKGDDDKLGKLRSTAKDLANLLGKTPAKTATFTMVAADPRIAAMDPTIEEAMAALRKQWETVSNAFSGRPVAILRAVLLDALAQASRAHDAIAVAFVSTARNALAYSESSDEASIWRNVLAEIETKVDARAEAEWTTPEMITVGDMQYSPPAAAAAKPRAYAVDLEALGAKIYPITGPWGPQAERNPYHFQNNPQDWGKEFANRLAAILATEFSGVVKAMSPTPIDISGPLSSLSAAVAEHVQGALASFSGATAGLQRRTNLLWWKEALYSPSAHASYRDLDPFDAAALMALDLHDLLPIYSPSSVSAFLNEAVRSLADEAIQTVELDADALLRGARTGTALQPLRAVAAQYVPAPAGRAPLLSLIGHPAEHGLLDSTAFRQFSGIDSSAKLTPSAWGTYLFRELQSARATAGSPAKKTRKK